MHGQYIRSMDRELTDQEDTILWLLRGDLKGETESEITAVQVQALPIKILATRMLQTETDSKCRRCKQFDETVKTSYQHAQFWQKNNTFSPFKTELNPVCHLLTLLEAHHILHISRIRVMRHERVCAQTTL